MATKLRIPVPRRGFGLSLGNSFQILGGEALKKLEGNWLEIEEREPHIFTVVGENLTEEGECLGFSKWNNEVVDLDAGNSCGSQLFEISNHLAWKDVTLTPSKLMAPSVERLIEALDHVEICAWDPWDT